MKNLINQMSKLDKELSCALARGRDLTPNEISYFFSAFRDISLYEVKTPVPPADRAELAKAQIGSTLVTYLLLAVLSPEPHAKEKYDVIYALLLFLGFHLRTP